MLNCAAVLMTALARGQDGPLLWIVPLILLGGARSGSVNGIGIALLRVPPIVMTLVDEYHPPGPAAHRDARLSAAAAPRRSSDSAPAGIGPVPGHPAALGGPRGRRRCSSNGAPPSDAISTRSGTSRTVATFSGVPVARTTITDLRDQRRAAALAGILLDGYARQSYLGMGDPYLFTSIAAVAIGGASILGGTGSYLGTIAGALVLTILTGLLPILRLDSGAPQRSSTALVILVTVSIAAPATQRLLGRALDPSRSRRPSGLGE